MMYLPPKINIAPNAKIPLFILNSCRIVLVLLLIFSSKLNNNLILNTEVEFLPYSYHLNAFDFSFA